MCFNPLVKFNVHLHDKCHSFSSIVQIKMSALTGSKNNKVTILKLKTCPCSLSTKMPPEKSPIAKARQRFLSHLSWGTHVRTLRVQILSPHSPARTPQCVPVLHNLMGDGPGTDPALYNSPNHSIQRKNGLTTFPIH